MKTYHESICPLGIGLPSFWLLFSQPALVLHIVQASNKMLSQKESKFHSDLFGVDLRFFPCHTCLILGWDWRTDWEIQSAMKAFGQRAASIHHMDPEGGKFSVCWLNNRIQKVKQKKKKILDEVGLECARSRPLLPLRKRHCSDSPMVWSTWPCTLPQSSREACHHPSSLLGLQGPGEAHFLPLRS